VATYDPITERVIAIIQKTMKLEDGRVTPASTFDDLAIDSLDGINIAFALESEFDVNIPDDALPKLRSVGDITAGISGLLAAKDSAGAQGNPDATAGSGGTAA